MFQFPIKMLKVKPADVSEMIILPTKTNNVLVSPGGNFWHSTRILSHNTCCEVKFILIVGLTANLKNPFKPFKFLDLYKYSSLCSWPAATLSTKCCLNL